MTGQMVVVVISFCAQEFDFLRVVMHSASSAVSESVFCVGLDIRE